LKVQRSQCHTPSACYRLFSMKKRERIFSSALHPGSKPQREYFNKGGSEKNITG